VSFSISNISLALSFRILSNPVLLQLQRRQTVSAVCFRSSYLHPTKLNTSNETELSKKQWTSSAIWRQSLSATTDTLMLLHNLHSRQKLNPAPTLTSHYQLHSFTVAHFNCYRIKIRVCLLCLIAETMSLVQPATKDVKNQRSKQLNWTTNCNVQWTQVTSSLSYVSQREGARRSKTAKGLSTRVQFKLKRILV
jgi:hypothetical protein